MNRHTAIGPLAWTLQRGARWLRWSLALTACLTAWIAVGCSGEGSQNSPAANGTLSMQLLTRLNGTTAYRLTQARFDVAGPVDTSLFSDDDINAPSILVTLPSGDYSIVLQDGWVLERQSMPGGPFEPVEALLVSENPRPFSIAEGRTTRVAYAFETDGVIIDLGEGVLEVTIEVTETGGGGLSREQIAAGLCERLDAVENCPPIPDCIATALSEFALFDSLPACPALVDAFFGCLAGASPSTFQCSTINTPEFIFGAPECAAEENELFTNIGSGVCP